MNRLMRLAQLAPLIALLAGCVSRIDDGSEVHIRYEYWVPLLQFAGGVALIVACFAITWRIRWGLLLGGLVCAGLPAPMTALTGAWVSADGFVVRYGGLGMLTTTDLKYDNISGIREITKKALGSRGQITYRPNLRFQLVSGGTVDIPIANDVMRQARQEILPRWRARQ